ncbi:MULTISPECIES: DUF1192 family protein [Xanthobacter]|uniref:DUF1192 family protein n=1 Tax=Xanthobacter TaxID=279 RepID=UPI0035AD855A
MDEEIKPKPVDPLAVADVSRLSVDEIEARIVTLKAEVARLEAALASKRASRAAADAAFKL